MRFCRYFYMTYMYMFVYFMFVILIFYTTKSTRFMHCNLYMYFVERVPVLCGINHACIDINCSFRARTYGERESSGPEQKPFLKCDINLEIPTIVSC